MADIHIHNIWHTVTDEGTIWLFSISIYSRLFSLNYRQAAPIMESLRLSAPQCSNETASFWVLKGLSSSVFSVHNGNQGRRVLKELGRFSWNTGEWTKLTLFPNPSAILRPLKCNAHKKSAGTTRFILIIMISTAPCRRKTETPAELAVLDYPTGLIFGITDTRLNWVPPKSYLFISHIIDSVLFLLQILLILFWAGIA